MSTHRALAALALALAWSCGDEEDSPPPVGGPSDAGESSGGTSGGTGAGGSSGRGGSNGGEPSGGTGGDAGGAGETNGGEGGTGTGGSSTGGTGTGGSAGSGPPTCPSDSQAGAPPEISAACDPEGAWGPLVDVPLMDGAAQLVGITPDELTIAWYGYANMDTRAFVADRASVTDVFEMGVELSAGDYVALSPDGLRIAALSSEGLLVELVRTGRDQPFGAPAEGTFAVLDADASENEITFSGAVIAPDDRTLYYLVNDGQSDQPLRVSTRGDSGPWPVGTPIEACEFQTHGGLQRVPTGVSADGLTLFFDDFVRGVSRAAWRETANEPFVWFIDLGTRSRPQPNTACNRLYFAAQSGPAYAEPQ